MSKVFISLTTIPTRLELLRKCLDSLINQRYPIEQIILTIPKNSLKGKKISRLPPYLSNPPYCDWVTIVRPYKDYGPVMKYIGGYKQLPIDSLVFVCDDDQQYNHNIVSRLVDRYNKVDEDQQDKTVICGDGYTIIGTDTVRGVGSVLLPFNGIKTIRHGVMNAWSYVRKACQYVDDNWASIILKKNNFKVINLELSFSKRYIDGVSYNPPDGLASTTNRLGDIVRCTYAIDHENTYPIVSIVMVLLFIIVILVNHYYLSYY